MSLPLILPWVPGNLPQGRGCVFPLRFTTFNSSQKLEHLVIVQTAIAISETLDRSPVSLGQSGNNNICPTDLSLLKVN